MDGDPESPLLTLPASQWLPNILQPTTHSFIPLSYKEKSSKATLDPGCHCTTALMIELDASTKLPIYRIVGYHRIDDPSAFDVRTEDLVAKKITDSKCKFKGTLDGGKPFKLTFKHDWKHASHRGHITVEWLLDNVTDHLHIDDSKLGRILRLAAE